MNCLREFEYNSKGETRLRNVFVLNANENYVHGLDFSVLSEDERKEVLEKLKDRTILPIRPKGEKAELIEGYNPEWNKAFKCFKRSSIINNDKFDASFNVIEEESETCQD